MSNMINYLAENLKELRASLGYTQQEMADLLNIGRSRYASYEENRAIPTIEMLISICNIYGTTDLYGLITKPLHDDSLPKVNSENKWILALKQIKKIVDNFAN